MKEKFDKTELLGATRQILSQIAIWTEYLYDAGASGRLVGNLPGIGDDSEREWTASGCAGPIIEKSIVLRNVGRVIDCFNSNVWNGDVDNLNSTYSALTPFHRLLKKSAALTSAVDYALDSDAVSSTYLILEIFYVRVKLEVNRDELELKELATIAGLAVKTVRMAAIGQDKNPELVTIKDGSRTYVKAEEAIRWLATKNVGFKPIEWFKEKLLPSYRPSNLSELGLYLRTLREKTNQSVSELGSHLGWEERIINEYSAIENGAETSDLSLFTIEKVMRLSQLLCPPESRELVRVIDRVIHPRLLEMKIAELLTNATGLKGE